MITNIEKLKSELFSRKIVYYEYAMKGCSESEVLELESRYGKFPLSYRQIIKTIGHGAGSLIKDDSTHFYISPSTRNFDNSIVRINEEFKIDREEALENEDGDLIHEDFFTIPECIFIIESWDGNDQYILTDPKEQKKRFSCLCPSR
ncbi:conserved hypothetical protein [Hyella patelloides LEGE 07179]|uniref:Knr4/Smi1-like domain-containing protein n=1 Tax=Hyella patelloides LEGE 07179 TaxID=945734 RepID=A0A563W3L5_9CYAN|nr:SMI1/KNR4 family protein [Hyella patelloides]VEP18289.1 conserved hypothetical protein [Hyella patelloides LEGE 07179]